MARTSSKSEVLSSKREVSSSKSGNELGYPDSFVGLRRSNRRCIAPCGTKMEPEYGYVLDEKTGERYVDVIGEVDVYRIKQESLSGTYLREIVSRYDRGLISRQEFEEIVSGDVGREIDLTDKPQSLFELMQAQLEAEEAFYSLPPDLRSYFGQSKERFYSAVVDGSISEISKKIMKEKFLDVVPDVVSDVEEGGDVHGAVES